MTLLSGIISLSPKASAKSSGMKIHFLRNATFILEVAGLKFLIDPMLSEKAAMDPVKISRNTTRIPMVDLPLQGNDLLKIIHSCDAVFVTHTHRDHWDAKALELIDKKMPLICQPSDIETLSKQNFTNLMPVTTVMEFKGVKIHRTGGQHGTGDIGLRMGHVSGFVIEHKQKKIYIAGDTIWCAEVEHALQTHKPDFIVVNAGAGQFDSGDPITMNAEDVGKVILAVPDAQVIVVHMEAVNHCPLTRADLKQFLDKNIPGHKTKIPGDGEKIST